MKKTTVVKQGNDISFAHKTSVPPAERLSVEEFMSFEFSPLVERIAKEQKISIGEAQLQFKDLLRFLYVCGTQTKLRPFFPPPAIDEAWHTFLLFTREYKEFCQKHFGYFVHHAPVTDALRKEHAVKAVNKNMATVLARKIFGPLSANWNVIKSHDCEQSCCPDFDCND